MAGGIVKGLSKVAWEAGEQFFKRMDKEKLVPEILGTITRQDMIKQIDLQEGAENVNLERIFRGIADGDDSMHEALGDYTRTLSGASHYQQNYARLDAAHNLREAGADRLS